MRASDFITEIAGAVAKNSEEAADPRYSMSMTDDVKPGEIKKQAKKMGFDVSTGGKPPELNAKAVKNSTPNNLFNLGL